MARIKNITDLYLIAHEANFKEFMIKMTEDANAYIPELNKIFRKLDYTNPHDQIVAEMLTATITASMVVLLEKYDSNAYSTILELFFKYLADFKRRDKEGTL